MNNRQLNKMILTAWTACLQAQVDILNKKQKYYKARLLTRKTTTGSVTGSRNRSSILSDVTSYFVIQISVGENFADSVLEFDFDVNNKAEAVLQPEHGVNELENRIENLKIQHENNKKQKHAPWSVVYDQLRAVVRILTDEPAPPPVG